MDLDVFKFAVENIKRHEGFKAVYYKDTEGFDTIGYGFKKATLYNHNIILIEPLHPLLAQHILNYFISEIYDRLWNEQKWTFFQPDEIIAVIIEMIYQLGMNGFLKFKKMIAALKKKNYFIAAIEMSDSKWAKQCPSRVKEMADIVKSFDDKDQLF